ncbi:hypothetical protein PVL29_015059 [Vitis rotundifolia]|uniref:Protein JASON n=2 Tax=Vitis rotundifolia TaxID=103349 RepID=A0AA39DL40_VITRO|nr:hypothetical protein PVL29_015059 [Vitis rotundifolia]
MIWSLLECELGFMCRFVRAMGCFFGCFRIKDDHQHRPNASFVSQSKSTETMISQNRLSALFLAEEKEDSLSKDRKSHVFESSEPENIDKELKDEARFLKACGTLVETPAEIRKASRRLKSSPSQDGDLEHSKFHSWLPNTSIKKLQLDKQPVEPPTPIKQCEEWRKESSLLEQTPSSCISNGQSSTEGSAVGNSDAVINVHPNPVDDSVPSVSPWLSAPNVQRRNRSVRFECEADAALFSSGSASSEIASQTSKRSESPSNHSVSKLSPYPTPLKLNDEFQTPGTVFPASLGNLENGKNARIRSQYVYSVLNPVENFSQWSVLKEEGSHSNQFSSNMGESLESLDDATPKAHVGARETSVAKDLRVEASLSSWLKPSSSIQDANDQNFKAVPAANRHFGRTPGDRPIIGTVAAHWNEDEPTRISPKWWDGNGIPNSTNKYKEDQKVSWHATPFEERLEKALSEESMISQRKQVDGKPINFEETEESDTALSQLQSRSHPKSVVSF